METNKNEFEQFLKEHVDGYKMYPSSTVWDNVQTTLQGKQRLTIATIFTLFIITILLSIVPNNETNFINNNKFTGANASLLLANTTATITPLTKTIETSLGNITYSIPTEKEGNHKNLPLTFVGYTNENNEQLNSFVSKTLKETKQDLVANAKITDNLTTATLPIEDVDLYNNIEPVVTGIQKEKQLVNLANTAALQLSNVQFQTVATSYSKLSPKSRWQYYFVPSISYRTLADERNLATTTTVIPTAPATPGSLEKSILHKPALGIELGASNVTPISRGLQFKIGAQLNYNQYDIKANQSKPEVATIALSNGGTQINSVTNLRNSEGSTPRWVNNNNLQVSIPIGVNLIVAGTNRVQIGIGTTVQPSYLIKNKMFLLSTDLKNYTTATDLIRKFNVNGGLETFVTLNGKHLRVQMGPQIRYQFLSSYNNKYPFKENLFDYGFKLGISKPF